MVRGEHPQGYVLWAADSLGWEFRRDIKLEAGLGVKQRVHKGKKRDSPRAKSTGVSLGQSNWEEATRYWHRVR